MNDSEQAACQHAISPPFGHSNTQGRTGHCCSPGGLLAPTWPRCSPKTLPLFWQFRGLNPVFPFPPDTPHWGTKRKRRRCRRKATQAQLSLSSKRKRLWERGRRKRKKVICSATARGEADTSCSMKQKRQTETKGWAFLCRLNQVCVQSNLPQAHTWTQKTHTYMHSMHCINRPHTPWCVKPFHLVHLYVQYPSLCKQLWLCVFACKRSSESGIKMRGACMH